MGIEGSQFVAVDEEGKVVSSHYCTNETWAIHDLMRSGNSYEEKYKERYPEGFDYEVVFDKEYKEIFPNSCEGEEGTK
jgi:hypothetical protein